MVSISLPGASTEARCAVPRRHQNIFHSPCGFLCSVRMRIVLRPQPTPGFSRPSSLSRNGELRPLRSAEASPPPHSLADILVPVRRDIHSYRRLTTADLLLVTQQVEQLGILTRGGLTGASNQNYRV
ncbi:hypothetical protein OKW40_003674 [Paraburkholderia sp. RAU6.4a]